MIADMATKVEAGRPLTWQSAALLDRGVRNTLACSHAKRFAADSAMEITIDAVQVYGGYGFIKEYPVEKLMRDAKIMQLYEGTSQIQRLVIAKEVLMGRNVDEPLPSRSGPRPRSRRSSPRPRRRRSEPSPANLGGKASPGEAGPLRVYRSVSTAPRVEGDHRTDRGEHDRRRARPPSPSRRLRLDGRVPEGGEDARRAP